MLLLTPCKFYKFKYTAYISHVGTPDVKLLRTTIVRRCRVGKEKAVDTEATADCSFVAFNRNNNRGPQFKHV